MRTLATSAASSCLCSCADEATFVLSEAADPTDCWLDRRSGCPLALTSASVSIPPRPCDLPPESPESRRVEWYTALRLPGPIIGPSGET